MSFNYTKSPWTYRSRIVTKSDGLKIRILGAKGYGQACGVQERSDKILRNDTKLVAYSPILYELAKQFISDSQCIIDTIDDDSDIGDLFFKKIVKEIENEKINTDLNDK